ncbi:MAG: hypothetical protein QOJ63_1876 [Solirubrobacteraceae bacterium]|jgi:hypothetical protein|nr:hypothetical protein [Solirubrobacteraceae bacterium]
MTELPQSYDRWQRQPFPTGSRTDAIDELQADLALADAWVADSLIPFVEDGVYDPARIDVIAELGDLRRRATDLAMSVSADERGLVDDYAGYLDLLLDVYQDFLDNGPHTP